MSVCHACSDPDVELETINAAAVLIGRAWRSHRRLMASMLMVTQRIEARDAAAADMLEAVAPEEDGDQPGEDADALQRA